MIVGWGSAESLDVVRIAASFEELSRACVPVPRHLVPFRSSPDTTLAMGGGGKHSFLAGGAWGTDGLGARCDTGSSSSCDERSHPVRTLGSIAFLACKGSQRRSAADAGLGPRGSAVGSRARARGAVEIPVPNEKWE